MPLGRRGLIAAAGSLAVPARARAPPAAPLRLGVLTDLPRRTAPCWSAAPLPRT